MSGIEGRRRGTGDVRKSSRTRSGVQGGKTESRDRVPSFHPEARRSAYGRADARPPMREWRRRALGPAADSDANARRSRLGPRGRAHRNARERHSNAVHAPSALRLPPPPLSASGPWWGVVGGGSVECMVLECIGEWGGGYGGRGPTVAGGRKGRPGRQRSRPKSDTLIRGGSGLGASALGDTSVVGPALTPRRGGSAGQPSCDSRAPDPRPPTPPRSRSFSPGHNPFFAPAPVLAGEGSGGGRGAPTPPASSLVGRALHLLTPSFTSGSASTC